LAEHPEIAGMTSAAWAALADYDAAVICTDHDGLDYAALAAAVPVVVDTRNALARAGVEATNVRKA
ncbi:MAG TPA: nucleotide sugar dehydrogenase, partial [Phenylobacterium sp.]|nr:nucleotide sugar dehydrogenase [Phenylobacterium sp.]